MGRGGWREWRWLGIFVTVKEDGNGHMGMQVRGCTVAVTVMGITVVDR